MPNLITSIIITAIFIIFFSQISVLIVYGGFVSKHVENVYMNLDENKILLNSIDPSMLSLRLLDKPYIAMTPFPLLSKYHIKGLGIVPRWSKLHKKINEYYAKALVNLLNEKC